MTRKNQLFKKSEYIVRAPRANILVRPFKNGRYVKGVGGRSFTVVGETDEDPTTLIFEVNQIIENALREAYGIKSDS